MSPAAYRGGGHLNLVIIGKNSSHNRTVGRNEKEELIMKLISILSRKPVLENVQESSGRGIKQVKIKNIKYLGKEDVYNMEVLIILCFQ